MMSDANPGLFTERIETMTTESSVELVNAKPLTSGKVGLTCSTRL